MWTCSTGLFRTNRGGVIMTRAGSAFCPVHPPFMLSRCGCAVLGQSRILIAVYVLFVLVDIECLAHRAAPSSCPVINEPVVSFLFISAFVSLS